VSPSLGKSLLIRAQSVELVPISRHQNQQNAVHINQTQHKQSAVVKTKNATRPKAMDMHDITARAAGILHKILRPSAGKRDSFVRTFYTIGKGD
jgi:hypothetical protein